MAQKPTSEFHGEVVRLWDQNFKLCGVRMVWHQIRLEQISKPGVNHGAENRWSKWGSVH